MKMQEISDILQQYYTDLAKYADDEWGPEAYEDGEVEESRSASSGGSSLTFLPLNGPAGMVTSSSSSSGGIARMNSNVARSNLRVATRSRLDDNKGSGKPT